MFATLLAHAQARPDSIALVEAQREISYSTLAQDIEAEAARLQAGGVAAGEVIALDLDGAIEEGYARICSLYALNCIGATILPIGPSMPAERRAWLLQEFRARPLPPVLARSGPAHGKAARGDEPGRLGMIRFSTGSTGTPKAVVVSNAKFAALQHVAAGALGFDEADRLLPPVPLPHPIGVRNMMRIHAAGGALVNAQLAFDLESLAAAIRRYRVTRVSASPAQLRWLLSRPAPPDFRLPPLKGLFTGGAPMLPAELDKVRQILTPNLWIDYGAVDFSIIAVQRPGDPPDSGLKLVPGMEAEVVGPDDRALPLGESGQLRLRAPWAPTGYADGRDAPQYRGGWFHPGDLARLGPDRRITLLGREDDIINRGGIKIVPEEIEAVLAGHPALRDNAVAGVPHPISGSAPVAFVVLRGEVDLDELRAYCRERIDEQRLPLAFVSVPEIPRSLEGKVLRAELRKLVKIDL